MTESITEGKILTEEGFSPKDTVGGIVERLQDGDEQAAREIWLRYFERVMYAARHKLGAAPTRVADEEDIAASVFESLFLGALEGRFQQLTDADSLWSLLLKITACKVVDQIRRQTRQKRGGGAVRGESIFLTDEQVNGLAQFVSSEATPELLVTLEDQHAKLRAELPDDVSRRIADAKIEGRTDREIGEELGLSEHAVGRRVRAIRSLWMCELGPQI